MPSADFKVVNKEWARKKFPERFKEVTTKEHGYDPDGSLRGIVTDIHERTGISIATVSRYLSGGMFPGIKVLLEIADAYQVSPDWLVGNDDVPPGQFSMSKLDELIPRPLLIYVLEVMAELRQSHKVSDEWFAEASVRILEMVSNNPDMSRQEIMGHAYELMRNGNQDAKKSDDATSKL